MTRGRQDMSTDNIEDEDFEEEDFEDEDFEEEVDDSDWLPRIIYEPWAFSGDLPEPDEVLRRRPDLADDPQWAIYRIGPDEGDIKVDRTGLTLDEAHEDFYG